MLRKDTRLEEFFNGRSESLLTSCVNFSHYCRLASCQCEGSTQRSNGSTGAIKKSCGVSSHYSNPCRFNLSYKAWRLTANIEAALALFPPTEESVMVINTFSASARLIPM
jgi:hypothetical protein